MSVEQWLAPTVISSLIAGAVAVATHLSSIRAKRMETREDIRTEAFDQAKTFYTDVISRQERELAQIRVDITDALVRVKQAEANADDARAAVRSLHKELRERDERIQDLQAIIARRPPTLRTRATDDPQVGYPYPSGPPEPLPYPEVP